MCRARFVPVACAAEASPGFEPCCTVTGGPAARPSCCRGQHEAKAGWAQQGAGSRCASLPRLLLRQVFLTSPTEVAKVRLQTQTQQRRPSASWPSAAPPLCPAPPSRSVSGPKYRGPLHCLATVAREEGLRGLYKGSSALLLRDGHSFATYFLSYTLLCEQLTPTGHSQPGERGPGPGRRGRAQHSGHRGRERRRSCQARVPQSLPRGPPQCPPHRESGQTRRVASHRSRRWCEPWAPFRGAPAWPPGCPRLACG